MKIKRNQLDILFSRYIRLKGNGKCEYCGIKKDFEQLQCSHFYGRRKLSTRYEPDNVSCLCFSCHQRLGENPEEHRQFFMRRLGPKRYLSLMLQANTPKKIDKKLIELWLKKELEKYV